MMYKDTEYKEQLIAYIEAVRDFPILLGGNMLARLAYWAYDKYYYIRRRG
jgi:hypothetical protein